MEEHMANNFMHFGRLGETTLAVDGSSQSHIEGT
jgi:hypothetical protein